MTTSVLADVEVGIIIIVNNVYCMYLCDYYMVIQKDTEIESEGQYKHMQSYSSGKGNFLFLELNSFLLDTALR